MKHIKDFGKFLNEGLFSSNSNDAESFKKRLQTFFTAAINNGGSFVSPCQKIEIFPDIYVIIETTTHMTYTAINWDKRFENENSANKEEAKRAGSSGYKIQTMDSSTSKVISNVEINSSEFSDIMKMCKDLEQKRMIAMAPKPAQKAEKPAEKPAQKPTQKPTQTQAQGLEQAPEV